MHRAISALSTPEPLRATFQHTQTERLLCKSTKIIGITKRYKEKNEIFRKIIWNVPKYFLSFFDKRSGKAERQRQKVSFDYPGKFPAREQDFTSIKKFLEKYRKNMLNYSYFQITY